MAKSEMSLREKLNISRWAIAHPRLTISFWLAIAVAGIFAYTSLKYALFPDITFPVVLVNASAPLTTTLDTEAKLTIPLEKSVTSLPDFQDVTSTTYSGQAIITVSFFPGTDITDSTKATQNALTQVSLPPGAKYDVIPLNLNESTAITYVLTSETKQLKDLIAIATQEIIPNLQSQPGVLKINLLGDDNLTGAPELGKYPTRVSFNGKNAVALQIVKKSNANTLEVVKQAEKAVKNLRTKLPQVEINLAETQAKFISQATQATIDDLILSLILAVLVIWFFLRRLEATVISAVAIPLSLLGTFIVMAFCGFQLETITLLALALIIGIIVDDAIVDVENISRLIDQGEAPKAATIKGTDEIGLTVVASTLTIVAVFLPVALMGGTVGQFFKPFGVTVSVAVLTSLLVARTLSPVLCVYWLRPHPLSDQNTHGEKVSPLQKKYTQLLSWGLTHRRIVILIALGSFIAGIALIPFIPKGFIPRLDRGAFNVIYTTPLPKLPTTQATPPTPSNGTPQNDGFDFLQSVANSPEKFLLRKTRRVGETLEKSISQFPDVASVFTIMGFQGDPTKGRMYVLLKEDRQLTTTQAQEKIREILPSIPGVTTSVEDLPFIDVQGEKPIKISLIGEDLDILRNTAQELKSQVTKLPGFVDVSISGQDKDDFGNYLQIDRENQQRVVYLSANLSQDQTLGNATDKVVGIAKSLLPPGVRLQQGADSARSSEVLGGFIPTLILSFICMIAVLVALFRGLLEPIVVALSLPLSIVGAMLALLITRSDFGMISLIGLIFLLGLVNKNSILLIDYVRQLRHKGWNRTDALIETGKLRLRPIIMTTVSSILGMLPLALGLGVGAELRQPMAVAIIGGLITSTLLSLIVVGVIYTLVDDLQAKMFRQY